MKKFILGIAIVAAMSAVPAFASGYKISNGDKYLKIGGRIQLQYHHEDPEGGESTDDLFFRRLRPYIEGSTHPNWKAKFQWDMGDSKVEIKDAFIEYSGYDMANVILGNYTFPFSMEQRISSKTQQEVERTWVGDHNYGSPDRQLGLHLEGSFAEKMVTWGAAVAMGAFDPDNKKLDFDTAASLNKDDDWSEGPMVGACLDYYPMGYYKPSQGDFDGKPKVNIGAAVFNWSNDDDNLSSYSSDNTSKVSADTVLGAEGHVGFRGFGISIDGQYNYFDSELVDADMMNGTTSGLYEDGKAKINIFAVEGGYMVVPETLELVAGYQSIDSDGYAKAWTRSSVGANIYVNKHDTKLQITYDWGANKDGEAGADVNDLRIQAQYVF